MMNPCIFVMQPSDEPRSTVGIAEPNALSLDREVGFILVAG